MLVPRPSFRPTKERRKLVRSLAAIGCKQESIATALGIRSPKTVRKHFRKELLQGMAEANAAVRRVAYEMASSGKYPIMTRFWLNTTEGWSQAGRPYDDDDDWDLDEWTGSE